MRNDTMDNKKQYSQEQLNEAVYTELFQQVPYNVAVIDREYNIVKANNNFQNYFGDWVNKKCYSVYKKLDEPCSDCPATDVFNSGKAIVADAVGVDQSGRKTHYIGHILPVNINGNSEEVDFVMEMTQPVTEINFWQREYQVLFDRVPCYITVIDEDYKIVRANEKFRENFGDVLGEHCYAVYKRRNTKCRNCPAKKTFSDGKVHNSTQEGIGKRGQKIDYAVSTSALTKGTGGVSHVIEISKDVTAIKHLEQKVLDAERLGAVGQTVAGLAHSIKNILMGLEGGKYIVSLGLKKNDKQMISRGWEMLERNFDKTTSLVKDFLSFSKGRIPKLKMLDPASLVEEIIDLYGEIAQQSGIALSSKISSNIKQAPFDPDGMQTCLTNLVSNAIDACLMSENHGSEVVIRLTEARGNITFEVSDNGSGIDYEIKHKIFTSFFTTKGGGGTGLGLLTTRKIVQEHGGKIVVDTKEGAGSKFRMMFPRKRLFTLYKDTKDLKPGDSNE